MRTILYTGKGGVGKTSVAAATSLLSSMLGYRTLVVSTDTAHSLSDVFDKQLGSVPVEVAPNLWGQEIDVYHELEVHWKTIQEWLVALFRWRGIDTIIAEELAILPGMEELVALLYITQYNRQGNMDVLIIDCAPTGETLRLLSFPEVARWYMRHLFPIEKKIIGTIAPVARRMFSVPVPREEVFESVEKLYLELEEMGAILLDGTKSSVRLVVNPERMVIKEAQRSFTYLNLYEYHTDLVVCNRILPHSVDGDFFESWKKSQGRYLELIEEAFSPIPILRAPLMKKEVVGLENLREFGRAIFQDKDPTQFFFTGHSQEYSREGGRVILKLHLPFVTREELSVIEDGQEVVIQAGRYRRNIFLPRPLIGHKVEDAQLEGDTLKLSFTQKQGEGG